MAIITDPDNLLDAAVDSAQNIFIDTAARTIKVRNNSAAPAGPELNNDGVTHQALYSFLKEEWKNDTKSKDLIAYPFPLIAITPEQFEWRFGWSPADDSSRSLLRTGGWREFDIDNSTQLREYIGTISLGNVQGTPTQSDAATVVQHKVYYAFFDSADGTSTAGPFDYDYAGEVNQAVETYRDLNGDGSPDFDRRGDILRLFIRSQPYTGPTADQQSKAWTFDQTDTTDIGLSAGTTLPFNTQRFPLVEGEDLNVKDRDGASITDAVIAAGVGAGQKYANAGGPTIDYLAADVASSTLGYSEDLFGTGPFNFGNIIDATSPTVTQLSNSELYSWVQYKLRQDSDIEFAAGTVKNGKLQDELLAFVGPTLTTKLATNLDQSGSKRGTAITNIRSADINNTQLRDTVNNALQSFPFSASVKITFSNDILADSDNAKATVFYDYTREYTGTNIIIADAGAAAGDATKDSCNITLTGFTTTPLLRVGTPNGLNTIAGQADDAYFKITGDATNADNNVIFGVSAIFDSARFAAITLDDTPTIVNVPGGIAGGTIRTHPINSPSSLKVDSAGTGVENTGGVVSLLATPPLYNGPETTVNTSDELIFSYSYDNNTQKDRLASTDVAINVRAIGLNSGQWVQQTASITRVNEIPVSVISAVERNYNNPT